MAKLNIALPDAMKEWVEDQTQTGLYVDAGDYIRDLIRKDQHRSANVAELQRLVDDGLASGVSDESMGDILDAMHNAGA